MSHLANFIDYGAAHSIKPTIDKHLQALFLQSSEISGKSEIFFLIFRSRLNIEGQEISRKVKETEYFQSTNKLSPFNSTS